MSYLDSACNIEFYKEILFPTITSGIALLGIVIAIIGGKTALKTYQLNTQQSILNEKQRRFEFFYGIFNKYLDDSRTKGLEGLFIEEEQIMAKEKSSWTQEDKDNLELLKKIPKVDKYYLLGIFEQVAIALKSGLINKEVAFYMFGYFSIRSYKSEGYFWANLPGERDSEYWKVYVEFVKEMQATENAGPINTAKVIY